MALNEWIGSELYNIHTNLIEIYILDCLYLLYICLFLLLLIYIETVSIITNDGRNIIVSKILRLISKFKLNHLYILLY